MIVLDASVALKWAFRDEVKAKEAVDLLSSHRDGHQEIHVPDLFPFEIGNALVNKKLFSEERVAQTLEYYLSLDLNTHTLSGEDFLRIARLARQYRTTFYDAAYVHLAQKLGCDLVTADQRLVQKVGLPFVKGL